MNTTLGLALWAAAGDTKPNSVPASAAPRRTDRIEPDVRHPPFGAATYSFAIDLSKDILCLQKRFASTDFSKIS
jgi:hypothetical protein